MNQNTKLFKSAFIIKIMTEMTIKIQDDLRPEIESFSEEELSLIVNKIIRELIRLHKLKKQEIIWDWPDQVQVLADEELLGEDWLSEEDEKAWKDL